MRFVGITLVLSCAVAYAQPKTKSTELFDQGRAFAEAGKWTEACAKFDESFKIERAPGTALNYGDCLEHLGQMRQAWLMFDGAAKDFERDKDGRAKFARERADAVGAKLAAITIKVADPALPGLVIKIGDAPVATAREINDRFDPGEVVITASAPGKTDFTTRANGLAGASVIVEIPADLGGTSSSDITGTTSHPGSRDKGRVRIAIITGGVGVATFAASIFVGLSAKSKYDEGVKKCPELDGTPVCSNDADKKVLDDAGSRANIGTGLAIAGGVLVGAAAVLYFTAPRETLQVTPTASPTGVGISLTGAF